MYAFREALDFRQALEKYADGKLTFAAADELLSNALSRAPDRAADFGDIVEETYGTHWLPKEIYLAALERIRAVQSADPTILLTSEPTQLLPVVHPPASSRSNDATDTAGSSWGNPFRWDPARTKPLGAGSTIKERFVLESEIGRGGMGRVFKARDLRKVEARDANPYVAIKVLNEAFKRHPLALQCLQREARKAQQIAHPNIVTVYDFDRDGTDVYLVMELLEGEPLDRILKRAAGVGVGLQHALAITQQMCQALSHAHAHGIVHADFKPSNVFLTRAGVIKIFDFGIARAVKIGNQAEDADTQFDPQTLGAITPAYASREVAEGETPDVRADLYAVACISHEMLTGRHPFKRMSGSAASKTNVVPAEPAGLSRRQRRVLRRALAFQRSERPESIAEFMREFAPQRRSPVYYAGGVAAAAGVVAALIVMQVLSPGDEDVIARTANAEALQREVQSGPREFVPLIASVRPIVLADGPENAANIRGRERVQSFVHDVAELPVREPAAAEPVHASGTSRPVDSAVMYADHVGAVEPAVDRVAVEPALDRIADTVQVAPLVVDPDLVPSPSPGPDIAAGQSIPLEQQLLNEAQANQLDEAEATLRALRAGAPVNDSFVTDGAPLAVAEAYLRAASLAVSNGRIEAARSLAERASELVPGSEEIAAVRRRYIRYCDIGDQLNRRDSFNRLIIYHLRWKISRLANEAPGEISAVRRRLATDFRQRIRATGDTALAERLSRAAQDILAEDAMLERTPERVVRDYASTRRSFGPYTSR